MSSLIEQSILEIENAGAEPRGGNRFTRVQDANAEIVRLCDRLGISALKPTFNVAKANARVRRLEEELSKKTKAAVALPVATAPAQPKPQLYGLDRMAAAIRVGDKSIADYERDNAVKTVKSDKPLTGLARMAAATKIIQ